MRMGLDPRANQLLQVVNQLEVFCQVLPRWPKRQVEGPSSGGVESAVLVNVPGLDLAREIHAVLVAWCELVAEERGVAAPDPRWSSWQRTPAGSWVANGGDTSSVVGWLRRHAAWMVDQPWYAETMWPELLEVRRRARSLTGLSRPPRFLVEAAVEVAVSGRPVAAVRGVTRARRADG